MNDQLGTCTSAFAKRLLSEISRHEGGLPAASAEIGVAPSDIAAIGNGDTTSEPALMAIYTWLEGRIDLSSEEREAYIRLRIESSQRSVAMTAGGSPATGEPTRQPGWSRRDSLIVGGGVIALIVIVVVVVLTIVLTVTIIRPASGRRTAGQDSSPTSPTATTPASPEPPTATAEPAPSGSGSPTAASPTSPTGGPAAGEPTGNLIANYRNYKLPCGDGITIGPGGAPAPQAFMAGDLSTECDGTWNAGDQENVGLLSGEATYSACAQDTVIDSQVSSITAGDVLCFQGTETIALITIAGTGQTGGINYTTIDVRVWRTGDSSGGS